MYGRGAGNEMVVAIDFGTTRTAYATTLQGLQEDNIEVDVPSGSSTAGTMHDSKTPSNVLLDEPGDKVLAYGYAAQERYASKKNANCLFFQHFKMGLADATTQEPMVEALNGRSMRLSDVIYKALEYVKDDVVRKLNKKGMELRATSIIWVITVPAIWNDWAKEMMRRAAHKAGMIRELRSPCLKIALEPECACISVQMDKVPGVLSDVGHKLMIVDCGGGTVDITAHQVECIDPLSLKELMAPDGGPYGATRVDAKFYEFFEAFIGHNNFETLKNRREFLAVSRSWEDRKLSFTGEECEDDDWFAPLNVGDAFVALRMQEDMEELVEKWNRKNSDRPVEELSSCTVGISFNLMMSFYAEPIQNIVNKIKSIMSSPENQPSLTGLRFIVIAGGFGRSPVLQDSLRHNFEKDDVKVVICLHPDLAIVKGAAVFGARPSVFESRKAKFTYGVGSAVRFDSSNPLHKQHESNKYRGIGGEWLLDKFSIHGHVGDDITVGSTSPRQNYLPLGEDQDEVMFRILATKAAEVFSTEETGVRCLGTWTVKVDMSLPYSQRGHDVEFSFGETENTCKCYKKTDFGEIQVNEVEVQFPSDLHWTSPTIE